MKKIKEIYKRLCNIKGVNKYTITIAIFLIIITFFDSSSLINRLKVYREKQKTEREIVKLKKEIEKNSEFIDAIKSSTKSLEKFAREEYKMKKENEDIYIIKEED